MFFPSLIAGRKKFKADTDLQDFLICDYYGIRMSERLPDAVISGRRNWWVGNDGRFHDVRPIRQVRLDGGIGDESSFIEKEDLEARLSKNGNGTLPDEETAPPLLRTGIPDPTL